MNALTIDVDELSRFVDIVKLSRQAVFIDKNKQKAYLIPAEAKFPAFYTTSLYDMDITDIDETFKDCFTIYCSVEY